MKQKFLIHKQYSRLLLFFAGWGADETPFRSLHPTQCDWMICYDYRSTDFDANLLANYSNITLVAWSMGVWVACRIMERFPHLPITRSIAINGTPYPIDGQRGIPPSTFERTLHNLDAKGLWKFQRRICGSAEAHKAFLRIIPQRSVDELAEELAALSEQCAVYSGTPFIWQKAVIGSDDRIFPPENQRRAWENNADHIEETEAPHYQETLFLKYLI